MEIDWEVKIALIVSELKRLSLTKLDMMPGITDKLFECVLRNKEITHLTLGSSKPLKTVGFERICTFSKIS